MIIKNLIKIVYSLEYTLVVNILHGFVFPLRDLYNNKHFRMILNWKSIFFNSLLLLSFAFYIINIKTNIFSNFLWEHYLSLSYCLILFLLYWLLQELSFKNSSWRFKSSLTFSYIKWISLIGLVSYLLSHLILLMPEGSKIDFYILIFCILFFYLIFRWSSKKIKDIKSLLLLIISLFLLRNILITIIPILLPYDWSQIVIDILTMSLFQLILYDISHSILPIYELDTTQGQWKEFMEKHFPKNPSYKKSLKDLGMEDVASRILYYELHGPNNQVMRITRLANYKFNLEELRALFWINEIHRHNALSSYVIKNSWSAYPIVFVRSDTEGIIPVDYSKILFDFSNDKPNDHVPFPFTDGFKIPVYSWEKKYDLHRDLNLSYRPSDDSHWENSRERLIVKTHYLKNGEPKEVLHHYTKIWDVVPPIVRDWKLNNSICVEQGIRNEQRVFIPYDPDNPMPAKRVGGLFIKYSDDRGGHQHVFCSTSNVSRAHEFEGDNTWILKKYYLATQKSLDPNWKLDTPYHGPSIYPHVHKEFAIAKSPTLKEIDFNNLNWNPLI